MGLFTKRRQDAPFSEFMRAALLFFDFAQPERAEKFAKQLGDAVPDPENAIFEWLVLDTVVVSRGIDRWLSVQAPEFREEAASIFWNDASTFLVQHFPRFINESCYRQVLDPKFRSWQSLLESVFSGKVTHANGPGWIVGKAYMEALGLDRNAVVAMNGATALLKIKHLEKTLKDMERYRIVPG